jgi:hypothetical protein
MDPPVVCHRCEQPGHGWRECDLPPAKSRQELQQRIARITDRWDAGHGMKTWVKTEIVKAEIRAFKPGKGKAA